MVTACSMMKCSHGVCECAGTRRTKRERERGRGTTLESHDCPDTAPRSQAASCLVRLQLPCTPRARSGEDLSPSPPGDGHEKIRDETHPRGNALILTEASRLRVGASLPGGEKNPVPLGPSAALVPLGGAASGRPRAPLARALITWGRGQDPVRARPEATKWGVGRAAGGLREAPWA